MKSDVPVFEAAVRAKLSKRRGGERRNDGEDGEKRKGEEKERTQRIYDGGGCRSEREPRLGERV